MTASPAAQSPSRGRIIAARTLLVLGVLLTVVSILSTYVKREALDADQFKQTSQELIASPAIQEQVAARWSMRSTRTSTSRASSTSKLPDEPPGLAGADRRALARARRPRRAGARSPGRAPRTRSSSSPSLSQQQFVKVLHGETKALETSDGNVVLDLRPLVLKLGDRFGFVEQPRRQDPAGRGAGHDPRVRRPEDGPEGHPLARAGRELRLDPRASPAGSARSGSPAAGAARRCARSGSASSSSACSSSSRAGLAGNYFVDNIVAERLGQARPRATPGTSSRSPSPRRAGSRSPSASSIAVGAWLVGPGDARHVGQGVARPGPASGRRSPGGRSSSRWLLIIWILPIQVFRTTRWSSSSLGAIGFVVFRRQLAAETRGSPGRGTAGRACAATGRRLVGERRRGSLSRAGAAVAAVAVEHDLVRAHAVVEPLRGLLERLLEAGVGERLDLAAVVADEVMVVLAVEV